VTQNKGDGRYRKVAMVSYITIDILDSILGVLNAKIQRLKKDPSKVGLKRTSGYYQQWKEFRKSQDKSKLAVPFTGVFVFTSPANRYKGNAHIVLVTNPAIYGFFKSIDAAASYKELSHVILYDLLRITKEDIRYLDNMHVHLADLDELRKSAAKTKNLKIDAIKKIIHRDHKKSPDDDRSSQDFVLEGKAGYQSWIQRGNKARSVAESSLEFFLTEKASKPS
jgi:hypothetical protein